MKIKLTYFLIAVFLFSAVGFGMPSYSSAQTVTAVSEDETIANLLEQIVLLQQQIERLRTQIERQDREIVELNRTLARGASGDDVRKLQAFLAEEGDVYPEGLITGFYGELTEAAVRRWQRKYLADEHAVGTVGPITMATINERQKSSSGLVTAVPFADTSTGASSDDSSDDSSSSGVGVVDIPDSTSTQGGATTTDGGDEKDEDSNGDIVVPGSGLGQNKVTICHVPPGNPSNAKTITIGEPALSAHLAKSSYLGPCQ